MAVKQHGPASVGLAFLLDEFGDLFDDPRNFGIMKVRPGHGDLNVDRTKETGLQYTMSGRTEQPMQCPICDSPNAKIEPTKRSFLGSLFGRQPSGLTTCSCSNCKQIWTVNEKDGWILEADKAMIAEAREEWARRGFVGPEIVCNGHSNGTTAEVYGFNEKAASWLKANVRTGRWMLEGRCVIVPIEEVYRIVAEAPRAGLVVKTNHI